MRLTLNFVAFLAAVTADQPVHCVRQQIYGEWKFHVAPREILDIYNTEEVCTHKIPNWMQIIPHEHVFEFIQEEVLLVKLLDDSKAEAQMCENADDLYCDSRVVYGTWSTMYDQSLIVELEDGRRFLANFKYSVRDEISTDPVADGADAFEELSSGDYDKFDSQCDRTMVGFVQNAPAITQQSFSMQEHEIQCFYGMQETQTYLMPDSPVEEQVITDKHEKQHSVAAFRRSRKTNYSKRINALKEHVPSEATDRLITFIADNLGWTPDLCLLQGGHPRKHGHNCDLAEPEKAETVDVKFFGDQEDPEFVAALDNVHQWSKNYKTADDIPDDQLPVSYDLTDIDGYDFTSAVRNQGDCGSCFAMSFIQVVESRLKFKYGDEQEPLSPQHLIQCNYMTEGCDGGWSYMNGLLAENGYMVSEKCAPYLGNTKDHECGDYAHCRPEAKVFQSYFVGGAYGESSEAKIMKEILRNGVVSAELNVPSTFSYYVEGILSGDLEAILQEFIENMDIEESDSDQLADMMMEDYGISWQTLNHAVVIFGWGVDEETGTKFWRVRNSYGEDWGMSGTFYVRRGQNDFGIETETTAFDVVRCQKGHGLKCVEQQP